MGQRKVRSRHFYRDMEASGYTPVSFLILCSLNIMSPPFREGQELEMGGAELEYEFRECAGPG